jgi:hypothetical protein
LLCNIGHLPGTYSVEKGLTRFLRTKNKKRPVSSLFTQHELATILKSADGEVSSSDYLHLSRVLAVLKLLSGFEAAASDQSKRLCKDFFAPFFLTELRSADIRWYELENLFDLARRLAYLNRDTALVDSPITVTVSPLLSQLTDPEGLTDDALRQSREIIAAYEHTVYERFYHAPIARKATAVVASITQELLESAQNPASQIMDWLKSSDLGDVIDPAEARRRLDRATPIGRTSWRSLFLNLGPRISLSEDELKRTLTGGDGDGKDVAVCISRYVPPSSVHTIEADHVHLDAFVIGEIENGQCTAKLIAWAADQFDKAGTKTDDYIEWIVKPEMSVIYTQLTSELLSHAYPGIQLSLQPWPLDRLGKFVKYPQRHNDVSIWLTAANLKDKLALHIVRKPVGAQRAVSSIKAELAGLAQLRTALINSWRSFRTIPRKRHFLITASLKLTRVVDGATIEREFDGGILQLSPRSGAGLLFLLETKSGNTSQKSANVLEKKIQELHLEAQITRLGKRSAFAALKL